MYRYYAAKSLSGLYLPGVKSGISMYLMILQATGYK